ncbi:latherin-like [Erinaceus europaeus]|uniref:Latherin-like n=1 Tax=Erinaceus europaeus TaxID=9365 RepID=A0ABM3X6G5_ERIEU|nr:latherin-like [Erinaceus europaeus]
MLRICGLFVLLCGLLAPSSGLFFPTPLDSKLNLDLVSDLKTGLNQAVESLNLNGGLDDLLQPLAGLLGLQGIKLEISNPKFFDLTFKKSSTNGKASLEIPLQIYLRLQTPLFNEKCKVSATIKGMLSFMRDQNGYDQIVFEDCGIVPESVQITSEKSFSLLGRAPNLESKLKGVIAQQLVRELCNSLNTMMTKLPPEFVSSIRRSLPEGDVKISI